MTQKLSISNNHTQENMIKQQLRTWGVLNKETLQILRRVPREYFVQNEFKTLAYSDTELALPGTGKMLEPKVQARLLQACEAKLNENILLVGAGSGYLVALLTEGAQAVTAMEIDTDNFAFAKRNLARFSFNSVHKAKIINQDATQLNEKESFDCILVCASSNYLPNCFFKALKPKARLIYFDYAAAVMNVYRWDKPNTNSKINANNFCQLAPRSYLFQANADPLINGIAKQLFTL